jgi:hypothetical protein
VKVWTRFSVGVSIGVAATVGCYAFAATTATRLVATFAPDAGADHARMGEFAHRLHEGDKPFARLAGPL